MFTKDEVKAILDKLEEMYPDAECALDHRNIFELLVAVVLSAQTTDVSVNKVAPALFGKYPDAEALAKADTEDIESIIHSIGMYRTKAKNIKALAKALCEKYDGDVPREHEQLIELPGVGRKTANVVRSVGFGEAAIAVDTHVFRVANRIGLANEKDVLKTELALMKAVPKDRWTKTHHSLIFHGRRCCDAKRPDCEHCGIKDFCREYNKDKGSKRLPGIEDYKR